MHAQVEFLAHETQRMDALIIARFSTKYPREQSCSPLPIPWFDGTPRLADELEMPLALEIDRGTEPLTILMNKARTYRDRTADGTYYAQRGGAVLPVFVVPTPHRVRQIGAEWRDMWPDGWGVITTPGAVADPTVRTLFSPEQWRRAIRG